MITEAQAAIFTFAVEMYRELNEDGYRTPPLEWFTAQAKKLADEIVANVQ